MQHLLPKKLDTLLDWIVFVADAQPIQRYTAYLAGAGLKVGHLEPHDEALNEWLQQVRTKLLDAEIMAGLKRLDLPDLDFTPSKQLVKDVAAAIENHQLGYAIITTVKPTSAAR